MSRYHENLVWQSADGTWNIGFYPQYSTGNYDDPDYDSEWDVDHDFDRFEWVSAGHPTSQAAIDSWTGSNPGCHTIAEYDPKRPEETARYEDMAAVLYEDARERAAESRGRIGGLYSGSTFTPISSPGYWGYEGPPKTRSLAAIKAQRDATYEAWISHLVNGYANGLDPRAAALDAKIAERLKTATPAEVAAFETTDAEHRARMRQQLADARERRREQARRDSRFGMYRGYDPQAGQRQRERDAREAEAETFFDKADAEAAARASMAAPKPKTSPAKPAAKKTPAKKAAPKPSTRRKTSAASTPGSFESTERAEATGVSLTGVSPSSGTTPPDDDPWAPLPSR